MSSMIRTLRRSIGRNDGAMSYREVLKRRSKLTEEQRKKAQIRKSRKSGLFKLFDKEGKPV